MEEMEKRLIEDGLDDKDIEMAGKIGIGCFALVAAAIVGIITMLLC